jgi:hypothetical protein
MSQIEIYSQIEKDISEWLLAHKTGLETLIDARFRPAHVFFQKDLPEAYTDGILNLIKREIENSMNLDPEILELTITPKFVRMIYGEHFFERRNS